MHCTDVPRPILSRDHPPVEPDEERPVPGNMKNHARHSEGVWILRQVVQNAGRNEYSHPSLAHSQDCRSRIEAASKADPTYRARVERAEQRKMDFFAKEVEQMDHAWRASLEPSVVP